MEPRKLWSSSSNRCEEPNALSGRRILTSTASQQLDLNPIGLGWAPLSGSKLKTFGSGLGRSEHFLT